MGPDNTSRNDPGHKTVVCPLFAVILACLFLCACANPLPPDRLQYAGDWQSPEMRLLILADGTVSYKRLKQGATVSVNGPLQRFEGDNFVVGIWSLTTTFVVSRPPYEENGQWKMVVDGVELTRVHGGSVSI
jgi:hypothetical protein